VPGQSFGKTWRFFGFSGHVQVSRVRPLIEHNKLKQNVPANRMMSVDFMRMPSSNAEIEPTLVL